MPSWPPRPWARSSWLSPRKPSFGHVPARGRHQWHVFYQKPTVFSVQCSLGSSQHFWTRACAGNKTANPFINILVPTWVHFCSGTCWHFSTGTSVHFSEGTFLHLVSGTWRIYCGGFRERRGREIATYIGADFLGSRAAALLWNLLASLMRNLVALGVGHLCNVNYVMLHRTKNL